MEQQKSDNPENEKFSKSNIAFPLSIIVTGGEKKKIRN